MCLQLISKTIITTVLHPSSFVPYYHSIANASGTNNDATARSELWGLRVAEGSHVKRTQVRPALVKVNALSKTLRCSNRTPSPSSYHECMPNDQCGPTAEMRLYQSWRSPSWLHASQLRMARKNVPEREIAPCFTSLTDAVFRMACLGLVLAGLGCMHYLYDKADRIAQERIQTASAHLKAKISIGRVARCNPVTGIRVKNVLVSKSANRYTDPLARASYIHASVSGYIGLVLYKRPLDVSISVSRGSLVISDLITTEYGRQNVKVPNCEELVQLLMRGSRSIPILTSSPFSRLLKLKTVSLNHSRLRFECIQQGLTDESVHSVDLVNTSAHLDLRNQGLEASTDLKQVEPSQAVIVASGSLLGGGHAHILVDVVQHIDDSSEASVSSVNASLKCSKVNIGSVSSFFSLPFKLKDGICTGNAELQLSPASSYTPNISGQAEVKSLGLRFDPSPESPELRNLAGKLRFRPNGVIFDYIEGELGSIPLEAKGHVDFNEGFNVESYARPFNVNRVIETFALNHFIPLEGSVIGKAVVRGCIDEPCISGWIKAVGNRAKADRVLLKSAMMTYDWDAVAGNLLFPSMRATVVGGGELIGSGGIYFDMTQETRYGHWNDKHHARNPKAIYWNTDEHVNKTLPPLPADDYEIDKWAPFRPYDSMDFEIKGTNVSGGNLIQWYGQKFGSTAVDAVGQIGGFCRISGHTQEANSRLVWRAVRQNSSRESSGELPAVPLSSNLRRIRAGSNLERLNLNSDRNQELFEASGTPGSTTVSGNDPLAEQATSSEESGTEFLGGLVYMKLGDLPEARRVKARTTLKEFHVKRLFSADPHFRQILLKAPNVVASMDTLFKGTVCMRPSWVDDPAKRTTLNIPLDLVSVDGGLAIRNLSLNGVVFRKIISGSLSLSATDVSVSLSESYLQNASPGPIQTDYERRAVPSEGAFEMLEVKLNTKGFFHVNSKWDDSEISASMSLNDGKHRVIQLHLKAVDLQQLSGGYNPLLGNEHIQGVLTTSIELDWTYQVGHMDLSVADLALGPVYFELLKGQLSLKDGEISLYEAILEHGRSKYKLEGKYFVRENSSDFEWFINVNADCAYVRDMSHLLDSGTKMLACDSRKLFFANHRNGSGFEPGSLSFRSGNHCLQKGSPITYWEVPEELPFTEQTKWLNQSSATRMDPDFADLFDKGKAQGNESCGMLDSENSLSGRITIYHPPRRSRDRQKRGNRNSHRGPLAALRNITLSFDLDGRDWMLHTSKIECITMSGLLEDGSLSIHPFQIKGEDGFLLEGEGSFTKNGSLDGSLSIRHATVSKFDVFRRAGLEATGLVDGNFGMKGNVSNPTFYGQVLWRNGTRNGKIFSHPHADMVCSNGRCVINLDVIMTGKEGQGQMTSTDNDKVSAALQYTSNGSKACSEEVTVEDVSSPRRQDMDSVTVRLSLPARLLMRQWVLPRLSRGFLQEGFDFLDQQHSFDDDWVFASVHVRRYGMALLNGLIPDIGWIGGDSDLTLQLSGTKNNPELIGSIKLKNGQMQPSWMTQPIKSLTGEVELRDSGLMSCKALSGRCNGRAISIRGGMFLSRRYLERLEEKLRELREMVKSADEVKKRTSRELQSSLHEAESTIRAGRGGIRVEVGGMPIQVPSDCTGTVSGKLLLTGTVLRPRIKGSLVFLDGFISANGALADFGRHRTTSAEPTPNRLVTSASKKPMKSSRIACHSIEAGTKSSKVGRYYHDCELFCVHMEQVTLSLGRNVRVVHPFLFNVFANGSISLSGKATNPNLSGKIRIVSGNISALPTRWTVRKSERSYVSFAHDSSREEENQEPTIKLVLESDTVILRVAECVISSWMDNISLSDKAGNHVQEQWWADAIHANEDDNRDGQKITKLLTSLMINTLAVGTTFGKCDLKFFPTYFGDAFPELSRRLYEKYGAGIQVDHDNFCFESNVFVDELKGCQIMIKIARATSLHLFRDQSRRFANLELRFPGRT